MWFCRQRNSYKSLYYQLAYVRIYLLLLTSPHPTATHHAILVLLPVDGKRVAMPLDVPLVYSVSRATNDIEGGSGKDLANQVVTVLRDKLEFSNEDMSYLRDMSVMNL